MISWKYSIEKINGELDLAQKKKQALNKLFDDEKVSQSTYDSFNNEIAAAIVEIEARQNTLVDKMKTKIGGLEQQMKTLEFLIVNSEIRHVSEEIEEEMYNREHDVLSLGLDTTRRELDEIKEAISRISEQNIGLPPQPPMQVEEEPVHGESEAEKDSETETDTATSVESTLEDQPVVEEGLETSVVEDQPVVEEGLETSVVEDQPVVEEGLETSVKEGIEEPVEAVSELAENVESPVEDVREPFRVEESGVEDVQESFRPEETELSEEAETSEATEEVSGEPEPDVSIEEEAAEE